ncbi:DUF134 domain-containing protein [Ammonifex thiophilus]|uniref:UPF0251 protein DXX99_03975 n=1 Tax=Ammonifex thiophilus TaxID=444093 RepID=A0A3D8P6Q0_9THEO|nr:DUF134 domain-containing protein [Ammonifex thiophilus]RDV84000.1 DUF134 domain-containing protein [Ammonifex thiophilus]
MPRPPKFRRVAFLPPFVVYKPQGIPLEETETVNLTVEELEALRLKDLEGLEQEECAERMGISRPTFQRLLVGARAKVAEALVKGKALRIEGGNFLLVTHRQCARCHEEWEASEGEVCPRCGAPRGKGRCRRRRGVWMLPPDAEE